MSRRSSKYKRDTPATNALIDARLLADEIRAVNPDVQYGSALSKAIDVAEKAHKISLQPLKELLLSADYENWAHDRGIYGVERR